MFLLIWVRGTLPRVRVDQLMEMGWKFLIPLQLINFLIVAMLVCLFGFRGMFAPGRNRDEGRGMRNESGAGLGTRGAGLDSHPPSLVPHPLESGGAP